MVWGDAWDPAVQYFMHLSADNNATTWLGPYAEKEEKILKPNANVPAGAMQMSSVPTTS